MSKIKVMVVDDSALVRQIVQAVLEREPDIEVIGVAADPLFALDRMTRCWPDVIVLDIEMPRMDGITFLKQIMRERPTPVVICSSHAGKGTKMTMQALKAGAVEIIARPKDGLKHYFAETSNVLISAVRAAAQANVKQLKPVPPPIIFEPKLNADAMLSPPDKRIIIQATVRIVAIGTSTGGTLALETVLAALPQECPGIVIVQHMPELFTASFAARLNDLCHINVREACHGDRVMPGLALIAPGGKHLLLSRNGANYQVEVRSGPPVNRHRPSVDVLFRSVAKCAGKNATGIIMTGMGDDGARGLKEMHNAGASTFAQNEETCVVFGMPKEAIKLGAVDRVLALQDIPMAILLGGALDCRN